MTHTAHEVQHDIGSAGRFGEFFVGLGIFILLGGIVLWVLGGMGYFDHGAAGAAGSRDSMTSGILFAVEGLGFLIFGAVAILSGWDRHHDHQA